MIKNIVIIACFIALIFSGNLSAGGIQIMSQPGEYQAPDSADWTLEETKIIGRQPESPSSVPNNRSGTIEITTSRPKYKNPIRSRSVPEQLRYERRKLSRAINGSSRPSRPMSLSKPKK